MWKKNMMDGKGTMEWGYEEKPSRKNTASIFSSKATSFVSTKSRTNTNESILANSDKGKYAGDWKANKMHGFGVFKWASGREYIGNYISDLKSGVG